jgi:hypothetical protein
MLSQLQNLQTFVHANLADVIDWRRHVSPDSKSTGDRAYIHIKTPFNSYRMGLGTAYGEPPAGAPAECRSRGWVSFDDDAAGKHILGAKADALNTEIVKHICTRELTDALAAARCEVAEASPETVGRARTRLADIAAKARKYGIDAKVPDAPAAAVQRPPEVPQTGLAQSNPAPMPETQTGDERERNRVRHLEETIEKVAAASAGEPWIGAPVIFITNPGEQIAGMQIIPGHVVRIQPDGRISMFLTADNSEPIYRDNLHRRGSPAGNGRVHQFNCWDFNPVVARDASRMRHLEESIEKMADEGNRDRQEIADLRQAVADLTARVAPVESPEPASAKASERAKKATAAAS